MAVYIGGSKGGRQGRAPPLGVQILSFSCSFQQKFEKEYQFWELAHPPGENPRSATGLPLALRLDSGVSVLVVCLLVYVQLHPAAAHQ